MDYLPRLPNYFHVLPSSSTVISHLLHFTSPYPTPTPTLSCPILHHLSPFRKKVLRYDTTITKVPLSQISIVFFLYVCKGKVVVQSGR